MAASFSLMRDRMLFSLPVMSPAMAAFNLFGDFSSLKVKEERWRVVGVNKWCKMVGGGCNREIVQKYLLQFFTRTD